MQLLNTDFDTDTQSELLPMDTIQQFKTHFAYWQNTSGKAPTPGPHSTSDLAQTVKEGQVHGLSLIWLHTLILGERMTLNYARYA
jgi:hypothetical protein